MLSKYHDDMCYETREQSIYIYHKIWLELSTGTVGAVLKTK